MKMLDVTQDLRSTRLSKCCLGISNAGLVDSAEAKKLVSHSRAVRQLMESGDKGLVRSAVSRIREVLDEADVPSVSDAVEGHLVALERVLP